MAIPGHLSGEMRRFWRDIARRYELQEEHIHVLRLACEAYDRAQAAREQIQRDGMLLGDKRHPLLGVEAKATELFYRGVRELGLDGEDAPETTATEAGTKAAMARWHGKGAA